VVEVLVIAVVAIPVILKTLEEFVVIFPQPALNVNAAADIAPLAIVKPFELL